MLQHSTGPFGCKAWVLKCSRMVESTCGAAAASSTGSLGRTLQAPSTALFAQSLSKLLSLIYLHMPIGADRLH